MFEWIARLRDRTRRSTLERELDEELAFHREQLARDARLAGASEESAQQQAARQLGNVTRARESARERWSIPWI
jgi:hypothetical protein